MLVVVFLKKIKLCTDQFYLFLFFFRKYISSQDISQVNFHKLIVSHILNETKTFFKILILFTFYFQSWLHFFKIH